MGRRLVAVIVLVHGLALCGLGFEINIAPQPVAQAPSFHYYWETRNVGGSAQLVTLFCTSCGPDAANGESIPLVSALRDTLGDEDRRNDRITYVWLLSLSRQNIGQQMLAGVPFFYWRVGGGSTHVKEDKPLKPLMDLTKPEQPMSIQVVRDVIQWVVLDPLSMPVRASSRAYRTNELGSERAHLEEAIEYLSKAPKSETGEGLSQGEADTVIARLALRESLLGGLVSTRQAERVGERRSAQEEMVRTRNWDLLRAFAEKAGLYFEPLAVSGAAGDYAILWFPVEAGSAEPVNSSHTAVWKALNLKDPWTDPRLQNWEGPVFNRAVDENGTLLPAGTMGARDVTVIPLGAYSLTYPKFPLLMVDFRDKLHLRRNEMTQRTINELTSGIIGISHFTNWYYYAGASLYDFVASRHGRGMDAARRLDSYAQFRSALELDTALEPRLRDLLKRRIESISLNPLESSPAHEIQVANAQYRALLHEVDSGQLALRLDKTRETELADFGKAPEERAAQAFVRTTTGGLFSRRFKENPNLVSELNWARRVQTDLDLLRSAVNAGPNPEIAYDPIRLRSAVGEVSELAPALRSSKVRKEAELTIQRLRDQTKDPELRADFSIGLTRIRESEGTGILAAPKVVESVFVPSDLKK